MIECQSLHKAENIPPNDVGLKIPSEAKLGVEWGATSAIPLAKDLNNVLFFGQSWLMLL